MLKTALRPRTLYLLFTILALCVLTPYLGTGYYSDDAVNSMLPAYLALKNKTVWQVIGHLNHSWIFNSGRLFPVAITTSYAAWYYLQDLLAYRIAQVTFVLSNLWLFMALIRIMGGGRRLALLCALTALTLFQLRNYSDPIASYVFLEQICLALGMGALLLLCHFRKTSQSWALWGSLALGACSLLHFETQLTFLPVLLYFSFKPLQSSRHHFAARWGHLFIGVAYLAVAIRLRLSAPLPYAGTRVHLGLKAIWTFICQFTGGLPLIYSVFGRSSFYSEKTLISSEFLTLQALGILIAGAVIFYLSLSLHSSDEPGAEDQRGLRLLGWTLALIPPFFVALSEKYQGQVNRPGVAYLPVYLSYFGIALLVGLKLARSRRPKLVTALFGLILAFTFSTNWIAVNRLNSYWDRPRTMLESLFQ